MNIPAEMLETVVDAMTLEARERVSRSLLYVIGGSDFVAADRATAGDVLGRINDPRFRNDRFRMPDDETLGFRWVLPPDGVSVTFQMGSDDRLADADEKPIHDVTLTRPFALNNFLVTHAQFSAFRDSASRSESGLDQSRRPVFSIANHPAVGVNWHAANAYCAWLTDTLRDDDSAPELARSGAWRISLPTEAQWEYAAGKGNNRPFPYGGPADPEKMNVNQSGIGSTSTVGIFPQGASADGLLDLAGNVFEWCRDAVPDDPRLGTYRPGMVDPLCEIGRRRAFRGGSWRFLSKSARLACRGSLSPTYSDDNIGFRLALVPAG